MKLSKDIQEQKRALRECTEPHEINFHTGVITGLVGFKDYLLRRESAARNKIQNQGKKETRRRTKKQLREDTAAFAARSTGLPRGRERDLCRTGTESSSEQGSQGLPSGVKIKPDRTG